MAVRKLSITLPAETVDQIHQCSDNVSAFIYDAVTAYFRNAELGKLLHELDEEFGPVPDDVMEEARHDWRVAMDEIEQAHRDASRARSADPR
jgi:hypothetical protein